MARSVCTCGEQLLWKADEPQSDEYLIVRKTALPEEEDWLALRNVSSSAVVCGACRRLWIEADNGSLIEYTPSAARQWRVGGT